MAIRHLLPLAALLLAVTSADATTTRPARIFAQTGMSLDTDGQPVPPVTLDPDSRDDLVELTYDLGRGRTLVLRTNLPPARRTDTAELAATVGRCHDFVERETGRQVQGDMLLYLMTFETVPRAYSFRVELASPDRWSQIRLALLDDRDTLTGPRASLHLQRLLYGTLPHELGHHLIEARPTVLHDIGSRPSYHTRWFTEGVCETLALRFARHECPAHAWRILHDRHTDSVLDSDDLRGRLLTWAQSDQLSWDLESDLYGGAMLLVVEWLQQEPLPTLLADLADTGGDHDGASLLTRLRHATDMTLAQIFEQAAISGRHLVEPAYSSR